MVETIRESILAVYNGLSEEQIEQSNRRRNAKFRKDGIEVRYSKVYTENPIMEFWKDGDPICFDCYMNSWKITPADYYHITKIIGFTDCGITEPPYLEDKYYCARCLRDEQDYDREQEKSDDMRVITVRLQLLSDLNG